MNDNRPANIFTKGLEFYPPRALTNKTEETKELLNKPARQVQSYEIDGHDVFVFELLKPINNIYGNYMLDKLIQLRIISLQSPPNKSNCLFITATTLDPNPSSIGKFYNILTVKNKSYTPESDQSLIVIAAERDAKDLGCQKIHNWTSRRETDEWWRKLGYETIKSKELTN